MIVYILGLPFDHKNTTGFMMGDDDKYTHIINNEYSIEVLFYQSSALYCCIIKDFCIELELKNSFFVTGKTSFLSVSEHFSSPEDAIVSACRNYKKHHHGPAMLQIIEKIEENYIIKDILE